MLKYGGVTLYRQLRPLFLGFILGHIFVSGFWVLFDYITGETGNRIPIYLRRKNECEQEIKKKLGRTARR